MNKKQFVEWFDDEVQQRWPRAHFTRKTLGDWFSAFGHIKAARLTEAVRRHKVFDDPSMPSTKRIIEILKAYNAPQPAGHEEPEQEVGEPVTYEEFWRIVRTEYTKAERIHLMKQLVKFDPCAAERDPQAYRWVMGRRKHVDSTAVAKDDAAAADAGRIGSALMPVQQRLLSG